MGWHSCLAAVEEQEAAATEAAEGMEVATGAATALASTEAVDRSRLHNTGRQGVEEAAIVGNKKNGALK